MLDQSGADIVNILTPPASHAALGVEAAMRGKHIIVEKPIDISLEAADRLINSCRENGVKLTCIFQNRFDDDIAALKQAIDKGTLGALNFGGSYTKWWRDQAYYDNRRARGSLQSDGGGSLMNQSIHYIDLLLSFMGPVKEVYGRIAGRTHRDTGVEDAGIATLVFQSGALGVIEGHTGAYPGFSAKLDLYGSSGTVVVEDNKITVWEMKDGTPKPGINKSDCTPHQKQISDFIKAVKSGGEPSVTGEMARRAVETVLAIYESGRTGKPILLAK
jgi:predicted dehydrogenase